MNIRLLTLFLLFYILQIGASCTKDATTPKVLLPFTLSNLQIDGIALGNKSANASLTPQITISFSEPIDKTSVANGLLLTGSTGNIPLNFSFSKKDSTVTISPTNALNYWKPYNLIINTDLLSASKKNLESSFASKIITQINPAPKFPTISDDELLTLTQKKTFQYFYDFAHPASGMARERNTSGNTVTTGGTGFGLMALLVGIERNFITRQQGVQQVNKVVTFL